MLAKMAEELKSCQNQRINSVFTLALTRSTTLIKLLAYIQVGLASSCAKKPPAVGVCGYSLTFSIKLPLSIALALALSL